MVALVETLSPFAFLIVGEGVKRHATVGDVCFKFFKRHSRCKNKYQ
jgi:hypothetical protein